MLDQEVVRHLLEELLSSGRTPEEVCANRPDLLDTVRSRWARLQEVAEDVDRAFPTSTTVWRQPGAGESEALPGIPGYEVEEIIGQGGMGRVYRARHIKLGRDVALKMLLTADHASARELAGLVRGTQSLAGLKHPHIVQVHDVDELDGLPYFTMEFVEGGSLSQKLRGEPNPPDSAPNPLRSSPTRCTRLMNGGLCTGTLSQEMFSSRRMGRSRSRTSVWRGALPETGTQ